MSVASLTVVYYVWLTSDFCYFVGDRLEEMAARLDFSIDYRPVRLFDVYDRTGGIRLKFRPEQRKAYRVAELNRWSRRLGMPINANAKYSGADDDLASCAILAAKRRGLPLA